MATEYILCWNMTQGAVFLLFPVFGWVADVYSLHYKLVKVAFALMAISSMLMLVAGIHNVFFLQVSTLAESTFLGLSVVTLVLGLCGLGIFEANAIQFGMRQLFEAPTAQLSSFVHWYYWGLHLGPLAIYYVAVLVFVFVKTTNNSYNGYYETKYIFGLAIFIPSLCQSVTTILGIVLAFKSKPYLEIDHVRFNPLKTVYKVVNYALRHKFPENRSAFTYWENTIPSRIDYGKDRYGGPFTNEEVEDTKVFFRLLLLIGSLFGFFLQGGNHSLTSLVVRKTGCPSTAVFLLLTMNPNHFTLVTVLLGIPMYRFLIRSQLMLRYVPKLLTRIWIGIVLLLMLDTTKSLLAILVSPSDQESVVCALNKTAIFMKNTPSTVAMCVLANIDIFNHVNDSSCQDIIQSSYLFYLLALPQVVRGICLLLVFMTALEFLCAQAPHTMRGLLIGLWYAMFSLQYLGSDSFVSYTIDSTGSVQDWSIYNGSRGFCIFVSLILYMVFWKYYRYRERNEIVNEQAIIEEQYERELLHNCQEIIEEQYERELLHNCQAIIEEQYERELLHNCQGVCYNSTDSTYDRQY